MQHAAGCGSPCNAAATPQATPCLHHIWWARTNCGLPVHSCVSMLANLLHAENTCGTATVGSSEVGDSRLVGARLLILLKTAPCAVQISADVVT